MVSKVRTFFFLILFLASSPLVLWAATATVTNNGNIPIRVQYKTPDGQYEELGDVKPGETMNVPGGVEKVRIVRDLGKWAEPLKPREVLDVEVKEGDQTVGKMDWYGDKVFFDGLTEGPPPISLIPVPAPEPSEEEFKPQEKPELETKDQTEPTQEPKPEAKPIEESPAWPWYGGVWDFFFPLMLVMMWPFLFLMWLRHLMRPGYYLEGEWIEAPRLGWGWGWHHYGENGGGMPCGMFGILSGLVFGLVLGGLSLWGRMHFAEGNGYGFLPFFAKDLYAFPLFIFESLPWLLFGEPNAISVFLFWVVLCTLLGGVGGITPFKWLYGTPCIVAILPFILFMRGCACSTPFAFDGGYEGGALYPPAFGTLFFLPMLFEAFLDFVDPYYELYEEEEEDLWHAFKSFFRGNPWPLLFFLAFWFGGAGLGLGYEYGWGGLNQFGFLNLFHDLPLMVGLPFLLPELAIILFWMLISGVLVWSFCEGLPRFSFYACLIPAFLILLFLTVGSYPQRELDFYREPISHAYRYPLISSVGEKTTQKTDTFQGIDQLRSGFGSGSSSSWGRDVQFEERQGAGERRNVRYEW
ncbi:MAG: hypothetical protein HYS55_00745 [Candidatus Omnitrophica bacterium]|nr:hypothetical protein [Candidatus Omnitrophota bacterium]